MRRIITYGTFDTLHFGHINLLVRARSLGDHLTVGLSTDEFNRIKGKEAYHSWIVRKRYLQSLRCVDQVIPETSWQQKEEDIVKLNIETFVMGDDWAGKFDQLSKIAQVVYLPRTPEVSSTRIRSLLKER